MTHAPAAHAHYTQRCARTAGREDRVAATVCPLLARRCRAAQSTSPASSEGCAGRAYARGCRRRTRGGTTSPSLRREPWLDATRGEARSCTTSSASGCLRLCAAPCRPHPRESRGTVHDMSATFRVGVSPRRLASLSCTAVGGPPADPLDTLPRLVFSSDLHGGSLATMLRRAAASGTAASALVVTLRESEGEGEEEEGRGGAGGAGGASAEEHPLAPRPPRHQPAGAQARPWPPSPLHDRRLLPDSVAAHAQPAQR